jgi:hypothetical protein
MKLNIITGLIYMMLLIFGQQVLTAVEPVKNEAETKSEMPGLRYWSPFKSSELIGSYVSIIIKNNDDKKSSYEFWKNTWGPKGAGDRHFTVQAGTTLDSICKNPVKAVFSGMLIDDVFEKNNPEKLAPGRGFTRTAIRYYPDIGYVLSACVCPDYKPGKVPLLPVIAVSKTGEKGTWRYLGILKGEPAEYAEKKYVWSDGGSLIRLKNGKWRFYLNGYRKTLCALESDTLEGPWKFIRDKKGEIREMGVKLPVKKQMRGGAIFPTVLKVSEKEWHCWFSDRWVPENIFHLYSTDGLNWKLYGKQPEINKSAFGNLSIKCLRAYLAPDRKSIIGLVSVWKKDKDGVYNYILHHARMPVGPPPATSRAPAN